WSADSIRAYCRSISLLNVDRRFQRSLWPRRIQRPKRLSEILHKREVREVTIVLGKANKLLVLRNGEAGARGIRTRSHEANVFELLARIQSQYPQAGRRARTKIVETAGDRPVPSPNIRSDLLRISAAKGNAPDTTRRVIEQLLPIRR